MAPRPARENQLSEEEIVAAALRLAARDGIDHLTMRGLAAELGVTPMAAYHYVPSKEALLHLVVTAVLGTMKPLNPDMPWDGELRRHALDTWEQLRKYPGIGTYLLSQHDLNLSNETLDRAGEFFRAAGFPEREALLAWATFNTFMFGRVAITAKLAGQKRQRPGGLTADDHFAFGLDVVLAGLRKQLATLTPAR
jgi:TetR/AcrR family tetracycline transcriptional repressor